MAQSGFTPIQLYYSTTPGNAPSAGNLASGELAINVTDGKLFYKDNLGVVRTIAQTSSVTNVASISFGTTGLTPATSTTGAVTVAGTLATTNGGTGLTSFNANGAVYATSSSALTTGTLPTTGGGTGLASFTANRVFYASSTSAIGQSANLTFDGTRLTAADFADSSLTSGRVTYAGTGGALSDSANFTFDGSNLQIGSQGDLRFGDSDNSNWVAFQGPATVGTNVTWTLPATDGSNGQALITNGTGTLSWATVAGAPGGSNTQIQYNNAGAFAGASGLVTDGSNLTLNAQGDLRFADSDSSNWVAFQAPATIASNVTWTLPNADGTSGQVLSTDGGGTLSWATVSGGGGGGGGTSTTTSQFTATGGQTTFNVTYTVGQISVYMNGALLAAADYTATNGTSVVLASGAASGDIVTVVAYSTATTISQLNTNVTVSDSGTNGTITLTTDGTEAMRVTNSGAILGGLTASTGSSPTRFQSKGAAGGGLPSAGYSIISANDEVAGQFVIVSSAQNTVSLTADPQNLRSNSSLEFAVDGTTIASMNSATATIGYTTARSYASAVATGNPFFYIGASNSTSEPVSALRVERGYGVHPGRNSNYYGIYASVLGSSQDTSNTTAAIYGEGIIDNASGVIGKGGTTTQKGYGVTGWGLAGTDGYGVAVGLRAICTQSGANPGNGTMVGLEISMPNYARSTSGGQYAIQYISAYTGSQTQYFAYIERNGVERGSITVTTSGTAYNTTSDYRLKENVQPMSGALEKVALLKPCTYVWKGSGEAGQGFIAHELQQVIPEAVTGEKDGVEEYAAEDGQVKTKPKYQAVDTSFLVATLTAAIQELKAELDTAKQRIAALEGK